MQIQWKREWAIVGVVSGGIGAAIGYAASIYKNKSERKITDAIDEMGADIYHLKGTLEKSTVNVLEAQWGIIRKLEQEDPTPPDEEEASGGEPEEDPENNPEELPIQALGISIGDVMVTPKPERTSVFAQVDQDNEGNENNGEWNYDLEIANRTEDAPYILHRDEFFDSEKHYGQSTLTYYKGDDVLVDDKEVPIYNAPVVIGEGNLRFGHGSGDESIVYIRNDKNDAEYEVILDHGYYQVEVLGTEIEDRLSEQKPIIHKMRSD